MTRHSDVTAGLLYGILTEPPSAPTYFRYLNFIVRDGFAFCMAQLHRVILEKYPKLLESSRTQLLWLIRELVALNIHDADALCVSLCRQVIGGDISQPNLWLITALLELLNQHKEWMYSHPKMIPMVFYTFLRIILDHMPRSQFLALRQQETAFLVMLYRDKGAELAVIGRDLVRLLHDVAAIPDFKQILTELISAADGSPEGSLDGQRSTPPPLDLTQLLMTRTPRLFLSSRLSPDMENQMRFLLTHVKMGMQKRYQQWFMARFLSTVESESLLSDLMRFICGVYHPTNAQLVSDVVQRWAVVGWLLKCVKTNSMYANVKLALFYDWLYFDPRTDNIMNIEPAMLLMVYSIPKYADITVSLLEFVLGAMDVYEGARKRLVQQGVRNSFHTLVSKGVVRNIDPIVQFPGLPSPLRDKLRSLFPALCTPVPGQSLSEPPSLPLPLQPLPLPLPQIQTQTNAGGGGASTVTQSPTSVSHSPHMQMVTPFKLDDKAPAPASDTWSEEVESAGSAEFQGGSSVRSNSDTGESTEDEGQALSWGEEGGTVSPASRDSLAVLGTSLTELGDAVRLLATGTGESAHCIKLLETVLDAYPSLDPSVSPELAAVLVRFLSPFSPHTPRRVPTPSSASPTRPSSPPVSGPSPVSPLFAACLRSPRYLILLRLMRALDLSYGYRFLKHILTVSSLLSSDPLSLKTHAANPLEPYNDFLLLFPPTTTPQEAFVVDVKACAEESLILATRMTVVALEYLPQATVSYPNLIHVLISIIDPVELCTLLLRLSTSELRVVGHPQDALPLLEQSLEWDSSEQALLWQIVTAEYALQAPSDALDLLRSLSKLSTFNPSLHAEAVCGMLALLRTCEPTLALVDFVLSLPAASYGRLQPAALSHWIVSGPLLQLLSSGICAASPTLSSRTSSRLSMAAHERAATVLYAVATRCRSLVPSVMRHPSVRSLLSSEHVLEVLQKLGLSADLTPMSPLAHTHPSGGDGGLRSEQLFDLSGRKRSLVLEDSEQTEVFDDSRGAVQRKRLKRS